jgi:hypothetical protein
MRAVAGLGRTILNAAMGLVALIVVMAVVGGVVGGIVVGVHSLLHRGADHPAEVAQPATPFSSTADQWQAGYQAASGFKTTWRCDTLIANLQGLLHRRESADFRDGCYQRVSKNRQPDATGHSAAWQEGYAHGPYTIETACELQAEFLATKMHQIAPGDVGGWAAGCLAWNHEHPEANA